MPLMKILICPLNWGLGHASRCIPIAEEFRRQGYQVDFASDGPALELLKKEFPLATFFELPGYNITYPSRNMLWNIGRKTFSLIKSIQQEKLALEKIVDQSGYDIVLSDNRLGCYTSRTYNIYMTHQMNILTPGNRFDTAASKAHHYFIRKYDECWIPDFSGEPNLTGRLGHGHSIKKPRYIGPVSRFVPLNKKIRFAITAVLSGPEPQRSIWEKELIRQLADFSEPVALVSGSSSVADQEIPETITHYPFLTSHQLNHLMSESEVIVCRGGYTTIMDLLALGKKAICVPTPGQTEQEYLTLLYEKKKYFLRQLQDEMNLKEALIHLDSYTGIPMKMEPGLLTEAVVSTSSTKFL